MQTSHTLPEAIAQANTLGNLLKAFVFLGVVIGAFLVFDSVSGGRRR